MSARARAQRTDTGVIGANVSAVQQFLTPKPADAHIGPNVHSRHAEPEAYYDSYLAETFEELWRRIRDDPPNYREEVDAAVDAFRQEIEDDLDQEDDMDPDREDVRNRAATLRAFQVDLQAIAETYLRVQERQREQAQLRVRFLNEDMKHGNDVLDMVDKYVQRCNVRIREWSAETIETLTTVITEFYPGEAAALIADLKSEDVETVLQTATRLFAEHPEELIATLSPQINVWLRIHDTNVRDISSGIVGRHVPNVDDIDHFRRDLEGGYRFLQAVRTRDEIEDTIFYIDIARQRLRIGTRIAEGTERILRGSQHHFNLVMRERYELMGAYGQGSRQDRKAIQAAGATFRWLFRQNVQVLKSSEELTAEIDHRVEELFDKRQARKKQADEEIMAAIAQIVRQEYMRHQQEEGNVPDPMLDERLEEFQSNGTQFLEVPADPDDFTDRQADAIADYAEELLRFSTEGMLEAIANLLYARTDTASRLFESKRKHRIERAQARLQLQHMNAQQGYPQVVFQGL